MNEQSILSNSESIVTIKKNNLLLLTYFLPEIPWLQQIAVEITTHDSSEYIIRINKALKSLRVIAGTNTIELFLSSEAEIEQLLLLCKNIRVIENSQQRFDEMKLAVIFFNHLFLGALNKYKHEGASEAFQQTLALLTAIFTPLPSILPIKQQQEIQDKLKVLKQLLTLPKTETLEIISLLEARNLIVSRDSKISIFQFLCDLPLSSISTESETKEVLAKACIDCFTSFSDATQIVCIYVNKNWEDELLKKQALDLFVGFLTNKFPVDSVMIDEDESTFRALSLLPEKLWKALLKNHPDIEAWLIPSQAWRSAREVYELNYSFFYQNGILVLYSQNHLEPRIVNLLPENALSIRILNFLSRVDDINTKYGTLFEDLAKCSINTVNEEFLKLFEALFFGEDFDFQIHAQNFVNELNILTDSVIKNSSRLVGEVFSKEEIEITSYPSTNFYISKAELFRIEYFFRLANFVYPREDYEPLLNKIILIEADEIKITIAIENNKTDIIFSKKEEKIEILSYGSALPGMINAMETLVTLPSDIGQEALAIYWESIIIMKILDTDRYLKTQMITAFALKGIPGSSLYRNIQTMLGEWENNANNIIEGFIIKVLSHEVLLSLLDFDEFSKLDIRGKLKHLYTLVSMCEGNFIPDAKPTHEISTNKETSTSKSKNSYSLFQPSFDHKISLSKNQLEIICCLLPASSWKLLLKSLYEGSYPIKIKTPPISVDRHEDGYLELSSSEEMVLYLKDLCKGVLWDENSVLMIRKTLDMLIAAKSLSNQNNLKLTQTILELEKLIEKMINTPQEIRFEEIQEIDILSNQLFNYLKEECYEQWINIVTYHPLSMDGFFSFLASKERGLINPQFKMIHFPCSIQIWYSTIKAFTESPILKAFPDLKDCLLGFSEQTFQIKDQPQACINFINTLTIWNLGINPDYIAIIELEETQNPFEAMYMKFCKQFNYYAQTCPHFITALLKIHELPDLTEEEKIQCFELFIKYQVKPNHPLLFKVLEIYEIACDQKKLNIKY